MVQYCRAKTEDREDLIDFINMVFSQSGKPHDFKKLLPKLYADDEDKMDCHYVVKDDGKIKAVVGVFPTVLEAGGQTLKIGQLGSVSAHPYARGKGYMKALMKYAIESAADEGYAALVLGGLKNRYQYFGFQPTEIAMKYRFIEENIRHQFGGGESTLRLEKITSPDSVWIKEAKALYDRRKVKIGRGSEEYFYKVLASWNNEIYALLKNGQFAGYMTAGDNGTFLREFELSDNADVPEVLKAWFKQKGIKALTVLCPAYEREKCELLGKYSEYFSAETGHSWLIFDFGKVLEAFMNVKNQCEPLEFGKLLLNIHKNDGDMQMCGFCVDENGVHAEKFLDKEDFKSKTKTVAGDGGAFRTGDDTAVLSVSQLDAQEAFFSEAGRYRNYGTEGGIKYKNWFPLPLYTEENDAC